MLEARDTVMNESWHLEAITGPDNCGVQSKAWRYFPGKGKYGGGQRKDHEWVGLTPAKSPHLEAPKCLFS